MPRYQLLEQREKGRVGAMLLSGFLALFDSFLGDHLWKAFFDADDDDSKVYLTTCGL